MNPTRRRLFIEVGSALVLSLSLVWAIMRSPRSPEAIILKYSLMERKGPEGELNGQRMRDELVACGTNAIQPVIAAIRTGWRSRGKAYFPHVLAQLGEPAHVALQTAFDQARDSLARESFNSALIVAFGDISRLPQVLAEFKSTAAADKQVGWILSDLKRMLPTEVPTPVVEDGSLNPSFEKWLSENKDSRLRGSLKESSAR